MAGPDESRTAPRWGLGQRIYFLHDGRPRDLVVAIEDHGGGVGDGRSEATAAVEPFCTINPIRAAGSSQFLRSL